MNRQTVKKTMALLLVAVMALGVSPVSAFAEETATTVEPAVTLADFEGTYTNLFPAFREEKYDAVWEEKLAEYCEVAAEDVPAVKDAFLSVYEADFHGEEAQKKFEEDPSYFLFDCKMANGVEYMTFDGDTISGTDAEGNEVFSHTYEYFDAMKQDYGPMTEVYMDGVPEEYWPLFYIYVSDGPDDEFKYFAFAGDTPAETYHMEFRYGSDPEALCEYFAGPYGFWMASTIYRDCDDEMMENCIDLFVSENADSIKGIAADLK